LSSGIIGKSKSAPRHGPEGTGRERFFGRKLHEKKAEKGQRGELIPGRDKAIPGKKKKRITIPIKRTWKGQEKEKEYKRKKSKTPEKK